MLKENNLIIMNSNEFQRFKKSKENMKILNVCCSFNKKLFSILQLLFFVTIGLFDRFFDKKRLISLKKIELLCFHTINIDL